LTAVHESITAYSQVFAARQAADEAIAVVFNPLEILQHDRPNSVDLRLGMGKSLADNALHALNRSGYAYDLMTLDDFLAGNKEYAVVIYLNTFTLDAQQFAALKKRSRQPGAVSVWCYAPGMVAPDGWSRSAMEELTGIKLDYSTERRRLSVLFSDNREFAAINHRNQPVTDAPVTFAVDKEAGVLARYGNNDPAVVVKNLPGGAKSIFAAVTPNHYEYWQRILAETPARAIAPGGLVMNKSGNVVYVYTHKSGKWSLDLPCGTRDLFGSQVKFVNGKLQLTSSGERCFLLLMP